MSVVGSVSGIGAIGSGGEQQTMAGGPTTSVAPSASDPGMMGGSSRVCLVQFMMRVVFTSLIVELQWLEHLWNYERCFRQGEFELMSVNHSTMSGGIIGICSGFSFI